MNTCAKRGSMSHAKYFGTNWGKKRNQIANHAAAAAPRTPQPNRDRRAVSMTTLPRQTRTARSATAYASAPAEVSDGLSLSTGLNVLTLGDAEFRTWCAYDALGIAAALRADVLVQTTCGRCEKPILLSFRIREPDRALILATTRRAAASTERAQDWGA